MILLKKLTLINFLSHEKTEITFNDSQKILIDGVSGAGKSSIFDAILWALYGQGRTENRSLVKRGAKKAVVELQLTDQREGEPDAIYTLIRTATQSGKHTLEIFIQRGTAESTAYPVSGVREAQLFIDRELVGASYLLFINSVAYVQGNSESFVSQTAPKRKELLLEIVKAEDYEKHYENARKTLSGIENERSVISGQRSELDARLVALKSRAGDRSVHEAVISTSTAQLVPVEATIKDLEEKKASLDALYQTVKILDPLLAKALDEEAELEKRIAEKRNRVANKPVLDESTGTEDITLLAALHTKLTAATDIENRRNEVRSRKPVIHDRSAENVRLEGQIAKIEAEPICPSKEACPYSGDHVGQITNLREDIAANKKQTDKETADMALWEAEMAALPPATDILVTMTSIKEVEARIKKRDDIKRELDTIAKDESDIPILQAAIVEKTKSIDAIVQQIADAKKATDGMGQFLADLATARNAERELKDAITKGRMLIEHIEKDEREIDQINLKWDELEKKETELKDKARKLSLLKDAFGSKGIETIVIDYLLPKLEDRINEVLAKLSDFRVRLDTQRKSADGESVIEGLFITILNEVNEEMPFESYSGGEKLKISVAISESLATLQKVGFRLFDETFIGLDENSTESFAEVLAGLNENFAQVLCISHLLQIKELFETKLTVRKSNNLSRVES